MVMTSYVFFASSMCSGVIAHGPKPGCILRSCSFPTMFFPTALVTALVATASWHVAAATPTSTLASRGEGTTLQLFSEEDFKGNSKSFDISSPGECTEIPPPLVHNVFSLKVGADLTCFLYTGSHCAGWRSNPYPAGEYPSIDGPEQSAESFGCISESQ
ncbi:hypothetical protein BD779DRAFT_639718 [Infundibulicybe gibba]|nr:hypothetical protein BD779DRAFT_639718 [Infundibulicybe gibba]